MSTAHVRDYGEHVWHVPSPNDPERRALCLARAEGRTWAQLLNTPPSAVCPTCGATALALAQFGGYV